MSSILSINKRGKLQRADNSLVFVEYGESGEIIKKIKIPILKISQIDIYSKVDFDSELLYLLNSYNIGINFFHNYTNTHYGEFNMWNQKGSEKLMMKQFDCYLNKRSYYIEKFYKGIIQNLIFVLSKYQKRGDIGKDITIISKDIRKKSLLINSNDNYLLFEASIWKTFYSSIDKIISKPEFKFIKRTKRPPENRMNALISLMNTKLYFTVNSIIKSTKLDNRIGFIHELTDTSRFSLALDIAELFKPFFILNNINNKKITSNDFSNNVLLNEFGLSKINKLYFEFLNQTVYVKNLKRKVSFKHLIKIECYKLIKSFYNDKEYQPINFKEVFDEDNFNI